jgi:hypothetical protein
LQNILQLGYDSGSGEVWVRYVKALVFYNIEPASSIWWEVMKAFLNRNADPRFCIHIFRRDNDPDDVLYCIDVAGVENKSLLDWVPHVIPKTRGGVPTIRLGEEGQNLSLRDVVEKLRPDDGEILRLIDKGLAIHNEPKSLAKNLESDLQTEPAETSIEEHESETLEKDNCSTGLWSRLKALSGVSKVSPILFLCIMICKYLQHQHPDNRNS